jgi:hypothetical protein
MSWAATTRASGSVPTTNHPTGEVASGAWRLSPLIQQKWGADEYPKVEMNALALLRGLGT